MVKINIQKVFFTNLKKISNEKGSVIHGMRNDDNGFKGFGEVYFSSIKYKKIKGWKFHKKMTCNLIVLLGRVRFVFSDGLNNFREEIVSSKNLVRITIPPKIWFGFQGVGKRNLLVNISNVKHRKNEVLQKNIKKMKFNWN